MRNQTKIPLDIPETKWLFKKGAVTDVSLLMTPVSGKVFALQEKLKAQKEQKKNTKDPTRVLAEDTSKKAPKAKAAVKAKGKAKAKATTSAKSVAIDDESKLNPEITVSSCHGLHLTRDKYFIDCLVLAIRSALHAARKRYGLSFTEDDAKAGHSPDTGSDVFVYSATEMQILETCVRHGIYFAYEGENMLAGKLHKKWSSMRPALQTYVIKLYAEAPMLALHVRLHDHDACIFERVLD